MSKEYVYAGGQMLATFDAAGNVTYQYHDHLSTRVEADANGNVTRTFGHFPFGEVSEDRTKSIVPRLALPLPR